jgi:hypothetical protein
VSWPNKRFNSTKWIFFEYGFSYLKHLLVPLQLSPQHHSGFASARLPSHLSLAPPDDFSQRLESELGAEHIALPACLRAWRLG